MVELRFANRDDVPAIVAFLRDHWRADHIFVRRPELLEWQHAGPGEGELNFVVAEVNESILGILGFIPLRRFDPDLFENAVGLAIWKVTSDAPVGTGLRLLQFLTKSFAPDSVAAVGLSEMVVPIYRALGYTVAVLDQFVVFDSALSSSVLTGQIVAPHPPRSGTLRALGTLSEADPAVADRVEKLARANRPEKSLEYLRSRFVEHPWFDYELLLLGRGDDPELIVVHRSVTVDGATAIRVVDVIGDIALLPESAVALGELASSRGAEYVDVLLSGADLEGMVAHGFRTATTEPSLIVPNYFAPFERRNVEVKIALRAENPDGLHFHSADTDQDRPNA